MHQVLSVAFIVSLLLAVAQGSVEHTMASEEQPREQPSQTFIVTMDDPPAQAYFNRDVPEGGSYRRVTRREAEVQEYCNKLKESHLDALARAGVAESQVAYHYDLTTNGFSARLTHEQVVALRANPKVVSVTADKMMHTTAGTSVHQAGHTHQTAKMEV